MLSFKVELDLVSHTGAAYEIDNRHDAMSYSWWESGNSLEKNGRKQEVVVWYCNMGVVSQS